MSERLWQLELTTDVGMMDGYVPLLEADSASCSWQLIDSDTRVHFLAIYNEESLAVQGERKLLLMAKSMGDEKVHVVFKPVPAVDWLEAYAQSAPALRVKRFYVFGSHLRHVPPPPESIPLWIDAATAFGSGEHATTAGCLEALDRLSQEKPPHHILDMGCGTGILAIAAAKLWPAAHVIAGDIDEEAVQVTHLNVERNQEKLMALVCNGFASKAIAANGPYDLIIANILAKPLCAMAPRLVAHLKPRGCVVLSGLLVAQEELVLNAYRAEGMSDIFTIRKGDWSTLVLRAGDKNDE